MGELGPNRDETDRLEQFGPRKSSATSNASTKTLASVNQPLDLAYSLEGVREFAASKLMDLRTLVNSDITAARNALAKHIAQIVLTPKQTPEGAVYEVSGDVDLFGGEQDVMLMVARDGIEPPTPAFSGLRSTD